ncbi:MAG: 16S rRNA (cytosine(1402)-N(4))-methyltransferase RsmH [Nitrospira sp.]|nr:16S rRNA (cytosine(1402)-N(4))-methyltransferase RsmH [bacterium]MBL7048188.1 16S rRNA (cytosine(1402)-N(4))-methyltransferase RsmH [Nitrospira sp.]
MAGEIMEALNLKSSGVYVDATLGLGGHSEMILQGAAGCTLIGIDRDDEALESSARRLEHYENVHLVKGRFSGVRELVNGIGYERVDGIVMDIGVSTLHLKSEERGFSFKSDAPLDMRMDRTQELTAADIVNRYPEKELADIIFNYGEERFSRRIARAIVYSRKKCQIRYCSELSDIIYKSIKNRGKIHPATRTFQALRIEVNRELEELSSAIESGAAILAPDARLCILSYHSLEDRIVKNAFRKLAAEGVFRIITKKPMVPERDEQRSNPSSRSAKLRIGEKI